LPPLTCSFLLFDGWKVDGGDGCFQHQRLSYIVHVLVMMMMVDYDDENAM
jgi:hypothetical protein